MRLFGKSGTLIRDAWIMFGIALLMPGLLEGGSTLWGTGVRDDFTIPSLVVEELRKQGMAVEATNFGESGYVSAQEIILLLQLLEKGQHPDWVVFYDGVNDLYSSFQQRAAGLPENEFHREREFNLSSPLRYRERQRLVLQDLARHLSTVRFLRSLLMPSAESGGGVAFSARAGVAGAAAFTFNPLGDFPSGECDGHPRTQQVLTVYRGGEGAGRTLPLQPPS